MDTQALATYRANTGQLAPFPLERFREFCRNCRVMTKEYGLRPLQLLGSQEYILQEMIKGIAEGASTFVILKARQLGASTFFLALDLFCAFEHGGITGAFATHEDGAAQVFRATIDMFLAHLPKRYKVRKVRHNRNMLILQNGSTFKYLVAGTKEKAGGATLGKSGAHVFIHATEVAFWGTENDIKELKATMAQRNPTRLQIWESTANGFNHWHDMWAGAKDSPTQRAIFVGWWRNELFRIEKEDPRFAMYVKNDSMSAEERSCWRAVKQQYDVEIEWEQIAWYRWCLDDEQKGDQSAMDERYPWTEEDAFQATGSKFFQVRALTEAMKAARLIPAMPFRYQLYDDWKKTDLMPLRDHKRAELKIWKEAEPDGVYVIGCDPAFGSSETANRTAICVLRCYADMCEQVAEYASPRVSTHECAWILCHLAGYYKRCRINLEITGPGNAVDLEMKSIRRQLMTTRERLETGGKLSDVFNLMTEFLYRRQDSLGGEFVRHTKTTQETKSFMANIFRDSVHLGRIKIPSMYLLEEMKTIEQDEDWIGASGNNQDDRVMAAILAHAAWKHWEQQKLQQRGMTYARAAADSKRPPGEQAVQRMVLNYLKTARIVVDGKETPTQVAGRAPVRRRPGWLPMPTDGTG